jgi:hypothetical protein
MKKSLVLGAAALAAFAFALPTPSDAGEVKMGGYYQFRMQSSNDTPWDDDVSLGRNDVDDANYWAHRLQLNMDFIASPKSHAHMVTRVLDSNTVEGANVAVGQDAANWNIRQAWLETEMWTVGVKVGEMPISLNDDILVNHDTTSFGTIMLSKSFNDTTVVLANVRMDEANRGVSYTDLNGDGNIDPADMSASSNSGIDADEDDIDLYVLSLLGKSRKACGNGCINYQLTAAALDSGNAADILDSGNAADMNDYWLAATVGTSWNGIDLTGTAIYDRGMEVGNVESDGGFLAALRATGKTAWGAWNGYAFYSEDTFQNVVGTNAGWSDTWDTGGPGGRDLMSNWAGYAGSGDGTTENLTGVGLGLKFNAAGWVINPMVDYAALTESGAGFATDSDGDGVADSEGAWGGTLKFTHQIDTGVTFGMQASYVDPDDTDGDDGVTMDAMHYYGADLKMVF